MVDTTYTDKVTVVETPSVQDFNDWTYRAKASSIADLRLLAVPSNNVTPFIVFVAGYYAAGDGGGGQFYWSAASVATDNGGTVIKPTAVSGAGRWLLIYTTPLDVRAFGVKVDDSTNNAVTLQAAMDAVGHVYFPDGVTRVGSTIRFNDRQTLTFASKAAILKGTSIAGAVLKGRDAETTRRYELTLWGGGISNTSKATAGGIALDLYAASDCKIFGTKLNDAETLVRCAGTSLLGSYYNEFHGVDSSSASVCAELGSFGNENKWFGGRFHDCSIGARLNDNSGNLFDGVAVELFTTYGFDVAPTTATQYTRIIAPRLEAASVGTGIRNSVLAQATTVIAPQFTTLAVNYTDASGDFTLISDNGWVIRSGTAIKKHIKVTAAIDFGLIAANTSTDSFVAITGVTAANSVFVTPDANIGANLMVMGIPASGGVYVRMANVSAAGIDPASMTFTVDVWQHVS